MPNRPIRSWNLVHIDLELGADTPDSVQYSEGYVDKISWDRREDKIHIYLESGKRFSSDLRIPEHPLIYSLLTCAYTASQPVRIGYQEGLEDQILCFGIPSN